MMVTLEDTLEWPVGTREALADLLEIQYGVNDSLVASLADDELALAVGRALQGKKPVPKVLRKRWKDRT